MSDVKARLLATADNGEMPTELAFDACERISSLEHRLVVAVEALRDITGQDCDDIPLRENAPARAKEALSAIGPLP